MFNSLKILLGKEQSKLEEVDNNKLFILNRWLSMEESNAEITSFVDKVTLGNINPAIKKQLLFLGINKSKRFIKYLKKEKDDNSLDIYLKRYYNLSNRELEIQRYLIDVNKELLKDMSVKFGWDKKTCKKYDVEFSEPKKEKLKKEKSKNLFNF